MNLKFLIVLFVAFSFASCSKDEMLTKEIGFIRYEVDGKPYQTSLTYQVENGDFSPYINTKIGSSNSNDGAGVMFTDHTGGKRNLLYLASGCIANSTAGLVCDSAVVDIEKGLLKVGAKIPFINGWATTNTKPVIYATVGFFADANMYSVSEMLNNETPTGLVRTKNDANNFEATFECVVAYKNSTQKSMLKKGFISVRKQ
jgi:hypothetical protein